MTVPSLKNAHTGVLISCSDETAARLNSEWQSVEQEQKAAKPTPRKRAAAKSNSDD